MKPQKAEWMEPNKRLGKIQTIVYYILMFVTVWDQNPKAVAKNTIIDITIEIASIIDDIWSIIYRILSLIIILIQLLCYIIIGIPIAYGLFRIKFVSDKFKTFMSKGVEDYEEVIESQESDFNKN